jgi:hypothetical protein
VDDPNKPVPVERIDSTEEMAALRWRLRNETRPQLSYSERKEVETIIACMFPERI